MSGMTARLILIGASGALGAVTLGAARKAGLALIATYGSRSFPGGQPFRAETDTLGRLGIGADDVVILFAAHSDQAWVRSHPEEARALNVAATVRLADEARRAGARMLFLSSEAVFGADRADGWPESAQPCPSTEYGRQKAEAERALLALGNACIVRTGWNVTPRAEDRCVVRSTYESLLDGSARLAEDNLFSLTDAEDTARLLVEAAARRATGIVHAVSGVPTARTALADEIMRASSKGRHMSYRRIRYSDLSFDEPRPACAWLAATDRGLHPAEGFALPPAVVARKVGILEVAAAARAAEGARP